jgi:flavin reductase
MNTEVFRDAMSRLGAAVHLITTDGPAGRHGFTASAVCSVTDGPPTLLVCINRASNSYSHFENNGILCVNVLAARHQVLSGRFASKANAAERFTEGRWTRLGTGAPVLEDAAAALDCRIAQITTVGTHGVFFCEVQDIVLGAAPEGLIYFNRAYHPLGPTTGSGC